MKPVERGGKGERERERKEKFGLFGFRMPMGLLMEQGWAQAGVFLVHLGQWNWDDWSNVWCSTGTPIKLSQPGDVVYQLLRVQLAAVVGYLPGYSS